MPDESTPEEQSGVSLKTVLKLVVLIGFLAGVVGFVLQNSNEVEVQFLSFTGTSSLYIIIILSMILGILAFEVVRLLWRRRRSGD
jgi:uncharacterized integral membrane protein